MIKLYSGKLRKLVTITLLIASFAMLLTTFSSSVGKVFAEANSATTSDNASDVATVAEPLTWSGTGTEADPYLISTAAELGQLATNVNAKQTYSGSYFKLTADIDLSTYNSGIWTPIGKYPNGWGTDSNAFCGNFNGNGYTISNMTITSTSTGAEFLGLFGYTYGATIKNVYLDNVSISVSGNRGTNNLAVGALVGQAAIGTHIYNCGVRSGSITCSSTDSGTGLKAVGGIVGDLLSKSTTYSYVSNCYSYIDITSNATTATNTQSFVGGIIGRIRNQSMSGDNILNYPLNCFYSGNLKGNQYLAPIVAGVYQNANNTAAAISGSTVIDDPTLSYYSSSSTFFQSDGTSPPNTDSNKRFETGYDPFGVSRDMSTELNSTVAELNTNISSLTTAYIPSGDASTWQAKDNKIAQTKERSDISVSITADAHNNLTADVKNVPSGETVSYQWLLNGENISGATNVTYSCPYDSIDDFTTSRTYSVAVTVPDVGIISSEPYIVVPVVSMTLSHSGTTATASTTFDSTFFGASTPTPTYSWTNATATSADGSVANITGAFGCTVSVNMTFTYAGSNFTLSNSFVYSDVIFVDQANGDDTYDGSSSTYTSGTNGPVKTITRAYQLSSLGTAVDANTIVICGGDTYYDAGTALTSFRGIYNCIFPELAMQDRTSAPSTVQTDWGTGWSEGKAVTFTTVYNGVDYGSGIYLQNSGNGDQHILLTGDTKFENIDFKVPKTDMNLQWYANGFDLTFGEGTTFSNIGNVAKQQNNGVSESSGNHKNIHIIGGSLSADKILGGNENTITIESGNFARVMGGGRNGDTFKKNLPYDANNASAGSYMYYSVPPEQYMYNSHIVIGGDADIALVCGGQTDGIYYGNSNITIKDNANVYQVTGGNLGYNRTKDSDRTNASLDYDTSLYKSSATALEGSPYFNDFKGSSTINIQGGTVNQVYGGGLGRYVWQCRTLGDIDINISGGNISEVYGGGAGGQVGDLEREGTKGSTVVSDIDYISNVSIDITGGTIGNVWGGSYGYYEYLDAGVVKNDDSAVYGSTNINISGANITGSVYGGGRGSSNYSSNTAIQTLASVYGNTNVVIDNATIGGSVFGGSKGVGVDYPEMAKILSYTTLGGTVVPASTNLKIYDGSIGGSAYAGSESAKIGIADDTSANTFVGISGGNINGNVFGGSDQAVVYGSTTVFIGKQDNKSATIEIGTVDSSGTVSGGSVFGGGNKSASGSDYDPSAPYVMGDTTVTVDGAGYDKAGMPVSTIRDSFFGSGNKCVVYGTQNLTLKNVGESFDIKHCKSIQRVTNLTIDNSYLELTGKVDSANLYPTNEYSLNRIVNFDLKNSTHLYLKKGCNLLQSFNSKDADGNKVTKAELGSSPGGGAEDNRVYIYPGEHMTVNKNENPSETDYGDVSGMCWLGSYEYDASNNIVEKDTFSEDELGIYVLANYDANLALSSYDERDGFLSALSDSTYGIGDTIIPQTDTATFRLWGLGSNSKNITCTLTASGNELAGKQISEQLLQANGSRYIFKFSQTEFTVGGGAQTGEEFTFVPESEINSNTPENEFALSVYSSDAGWMNNNTLIQEVTGGTGTGTTMTDSQPVYASSVQSEFSSVKLRLMCGNNFTHDGSPVVSVQFPIVVQKQLANGNWVQNAIINITININRILLDESAIGTVDYGKHYDNVYNIYDVAPTSDEPKYTISNKASATVQYCRTYKDTGASSGSTSISSRKIDFYNANDKNNPISCTLPAGTQITMVDKSSGSPLYYYYTLPADSSSVNLTNFKAVGTDTNYVNNVQTTQSGDDLYVSENFLFVFDFSNTASFSNPHFQCRFESLNSSGGSVFNSNLGKIVGFRIDDTSSTYAGSLSASPTKYNKNQNINLSSSFSVSGSSSSSDRNYALGVQFSLYEKDPTGDTYTQIDFPKGSAFSYAGKKYPTDSSGKYSVVPLVSEVGNISNVSLTLDLSGKSETLAAGNYRLKADYVALTDMNTMAVVKTLAADSVADFEVKDNKYSINLDVPDNEILIYDNGTTIGGSTNLDFEAKALKQPLAAGNPISYMSISKKNSTDGTYDSVPLNSLFSGFESGVYEREFSFGEQSAENVPVNLSASIALNASIEEGTYCIQLNIYEGVKSTEALRDVDYIYVIVKSPS